MSNEQQQHDLRALKAFAIRHGYQWRNELRSLWAADNDLGWQRRLRNTAGSAGLDKIRSEDLTRRGIVDSTLLAASAVALTVGYFVLIPVCEAFLHIALIINRIGE